jgi:hypothetical protein
MSLIPAKRAAPTTSEQSSKKTLVRNPTVPFSSLVTILTNKRGPSGDLCLKESSRGGGKAQFRKAAIHNLHERNQELYSAFERHVHGRMHTNCGGLSVTEFFSIVLNGMSSNENIATFDQPDLRTLRKTKSDLQSETGLVYIAVFGKDGLTTNVNGLCEWFGNLKNTANIRLMLYLGRNHLHVYDMPKLTTAIQD